MSGKSTADMGRYNWMRFKTRRVALRVPRCSALTAAIAPFCGRGWVEVSTEYAYKLFGPR